MINASSSIIIQGYSTELNNAGSPLNQEIMLPPFVHHLRDCVPDDNAGFLYLLLRQSSGDTDLQSRSRLGIDRFRDGCSRHALQSRYEHAVGEALQA